MLFLQQQTWGFRPRRIEKKLFPNVCDDDRQPEVATLPTNRAAMLLLPDVGFGKKIIINAMYNSKSNSNNSDL